MSVLNNKLLIISLIFRYVRVQTIARRRRRRHRCLQNLRSNIVALGMFIPSHFLLKLLFKGILVTNSGMYIGLYFSASVGHS